MNGNIKNSSDQSNEDKPIKEIQTDEIMTENFENQCPEDFFQTFGKKNEDEEDLQNLANTQRFLQYFQFFHKFFIFSIFSCFHLIKVHKQRRSFNRGDPFEKRHRKADEKAAESKRASFLPFPSVFPFLLLSQNPRCFSRS